MFDALYIGATGMQAQQLNVDTIANNLANMNTTGFKKSRVSFTDLVAQEAARLQPMSDAPSGPLSVLPRLGAGVGVSNVTKLFDAGDLQQTGSPFDVAIQGDGFLEIALPDGSRAFTRGGTFKVNANGMLVTQAGYVVKPGISVPSNAKNLTITADGHVSMAVPNQAAPVQAGQLELVHFASPGLLLAQGDNLYRSTDASGEPVVGKAGQDNLGTFAQGYLEGSNVKMTDEMVGLMVAQRAYEANVKVVQASDEILGMVNNLRK
ncbi:flagellar basal-body rod protein FlgG [Ralstonia sp. 1138]|uniref:flagellar basal-body rod protein FlgG n=1 Tax=Ralstonia sp. 1138 TaxID=3156423 RepID=UPI003391DA62